MRRVLRILGLLIVAAFATALVVAFAARFRDGPIGPFPGGPFAGAVETGPEPDWSLLDSVSEVDLQVHPAAPRTVRTWVLHHDGLPYVPAGAAARKRWPAQVEADPRVVLRAEGRLHARSAVRVTDPALLESLLRAIGEKYGVGGGRFADPSTTWFFRLDPPG